MPILIRNGLLVTDPLAGQFRSGTLLVREGRIDSLDPTLIPPGTEEIDAGGCWLLPGLIDAHTHLYSALALGMPLRAEPPRNFPQVLERIWWRLDKALRPEDVRYSGYIGALASLSGGVTTLFDHHASPSCAPGSLGILAEVTQELGLRASLAYEVSDRDGLAARDEGIEENRRFILRCHQAGSPLLRAHFGLHAVFTLSDASLRKCAELGCALGAGFHLHLLEHRAERDRFEAEHPELAVVEFLEEAGLLGPQTIAAHAVHISPLDARRLARTRTFTVHNPKSNMGNGVGIAPLDLLLRQGAAAGLGSDGYYDLAQELTTAPLLQNLGQGDPSALSPSEALRLAYGHNAALAAGTFGLPFGRLAPGYVADLLIVPYDPPTPVHAGNLSAHILAALVGGPRDVLIAGVPRLRERRVPGLDVAAVKRRARELAADLWQRL